MAKPVADEEELYRRVFGKKTSRRPLTVASLRALQSITNRDFLPISVLSDFLGSIPEPKESLEKRVKRLEEEMSRLKKQQKLSEEPTRADLIYEKFRVQLEKEHFGKVVAIDVDSGTIAGTGDTVLDAFRNAREKSSKARFSYKRVGYPYVYRL